MSPATHHDDRLGRLENQLLDQADDLSSLIRSVGAVETVAQITAAQVKNILNRPTPVGAIITGSGVFLSILALALTPVAWLAISNHAENTRQSEVIAMRGEIVGELRAEVRILNERNDRLEERLLFLERESMKR